MDKSLIKREQRDATKIFETAEKALEKIKADNSNDPLLLAVTALEEIVPIAKRMDARTGKMDPSLRKPRAAKRGKR